MYFKLGDVRPYNPVLASRLRSRLRCRPHVLTPQDFTDWRRKQVSASGGRVAVRGYNTGAKASITIDENTSTFPTQPGHLAGIHKNQTPALTEGS